MSRFLKHPLRVDPVCLTLLLNYPLSAGPCQQDVRVLYNQMAGREVDEPDAPIETSLDQILAYIRNHWEKVTERNRAETDNYLECKVRVPRLLR